MTDEHNTPTPNHDQIQLDLQDKAQELFENMLPAVARAFRALKSAKLYAQGKRVGFFMPPDSDIVLEAINSVKALWEFPLGGKGVVDMVLKTPSPACIRVFIEVKPLIPSVGALIRQINLYRRYADEIWSPDRNFFYACSHDRRWISTLLSQDIGFIEYPEMVVHNPHGRA